jgi:hypothetical protein
MVARGLSKCTERKAHRGGGVKLSISHKISSKTDPIVYMRNVINLTPCAFLLLSVSRAPLFGPEYESLSLFNRDRYSSCATR